MNISDLLNVNGDLQAEKNNAEKLVALNEKTAEYGLTLTEKEALEIVRAHKETLKITDRIEVGDGIVGKLIEKFASSPYIDKWSYKETIEGLVAIFYRFKNETEDLVIDGEFLSVMKNAFDGECNGSLELLEDKFLPEYAENIRRSFYGRRNNL